MAHKEQTKLIFNEQANEEEESETISSIQHVQCHSSFSMNEPNGFEESSWCVRVCMPKMKKKKTT